MFKLTAVISLMLIATWSQAELRRTKKLGSPMADFDSGSTLWAASMPCDSCGSECASACGTRHFRSCCFNYLRKKRGPDSAKLWFQNLHDMKTESAQRPKMPFLVEEIPDTWANFISNEYKPYPMDDNFENRMQLIYDV